MGYKRAEWHSGLTYEQTCHACKTLVRYTDHALDFRPWYADGFVYCPKCKTPLRHNENLAIDAPKTVSVPTAAPAPAVPTGTPEAKFCSQCGAKFADGARFCAQCGSKRG